MIESRVAFITGAASGIGLETTKRFVQDPRYNPIFAIDRDPSVLTIFQTPESSSIIPVQLDLRDKDRVTDILRRAAVESGRLDIVVNAAGIMVKGSVGSWLNEEGSSIPELEEMNQVNFRAPLNIMLEAVEVMRDVGGGTIINVTSAKYLFPDLYHVSYQRGKRLLSKITRGLAKEWMKRDNVRLVDVQPGNTKTNIDRGAWIEGGKTETDFSQAVADWWRETFGNDPRNVAEIIYQIAEGKIRGTTIPVGLDAKIGRFLNFVTAPLLGYRWDSAFFIGSTIFYLIGARLLRFARNDRNGKLQW